jgi:phage tail P2-like protein
VSDLLPANATPLERALSLALDRAGAIPTPAALMWDPTRIPAAFLPWLAWGFSVDDWSPDWTEAEKRAVIASSAAWHRMKGTRGSIEAVLVAMGYGTAELIEDRDLPRIGDPDIALGGDWRLGPSDPSWADYWITVTSPVRRSAADRLAGRLEDTAPARCRLRSISMPGAQYELGDGLWLIGDDVAIGNVYFYEVENG